MPRRCSICSLPPEELDMVNLLLASGRQSLRSISARFGVSKQALARHRDKHLPTELIRSKQIEDLARADKLGEQIQILARSVLKVLQQAQEEAPSGPWQKRASFSKIALEAARQLVDMAVLLEKVSGTATAAVGYRELITQPQFTELRAVILQVVRDDPGARERTIQALREMVGSNGDGSHGVNRPDGVRDELGLSPG